MEVLDKEMSPEKGFWVHAECHLRITAQQVKDGQLGKKGLDARELLLLEAEGVDVADLPDEDEEVEELSGAVHGLLSRMVAAEMAREQQQQEAAVDEAAMEQEYDWAGAFG